MPTPPQTPPPDPTRKGLLQWARASLEAAGRDAPHRTATWLLVDVLSCRRVDLHRNPDAGVEPRDAETYQTLVRRCAEGEPLQHVLGHDEFYGLSLRITPDVLIPRPETEEVVERTLDLLASVNTPRVLDVGTGSGCIALALADQRPDATVLACDVSPAALDVARENGERLSLPVTWFEGDLLASDFVETAEQAGADALDVVISNPPYIPDAEAASLPDVVRDYDPPTALFAGEDPLRFYRRLAAVGRDLCRPGGLLVTETHADFAEGVGDVFREAGWREVHVETDLADRPRIAWGRWGHADGTGENRKADEDGKGQRTA